MARGGGWESLGPHRGLQGQQQGQGGKGSPTYRVFDQAAGSIPGVSLESYLILLTAGINPILQMQKLSLEMILFFARWQTAGGRLKPRKSGWLQSYT